VDVMMKFTSYEEMAERFGEPDRNNYDCIYDGQIETPGSPANQRFAGVEGDLEAIWTKFNEHRPPGYNGHPLSMSDVVELYDHSGSEYHYVDRFGFKQIGFESQPEQTQGMTMNR
jgi:hypothetical protein